MVKIAKEGYIIGGVCDRTHKARAARERGAKYFLNWMREKGCFSYNRGWYKLKKLLLPPDKEMWSLCGEFGGEFGGDFEVGAWRFRQEVMPILQKTKQSFRWSWAIKWAEDIASFEFGVTKEVKEEGPLWILNPDTKGRFTLCRPHRDNIYQSRKARGDL